MREKDFLKTKRKLTIMFTLLVFIIAIILEFSFFSTKYINSIHREKTDFKLVTVSLEKKILSVDQFITLFKARNKVFPIMKRGMGKPQNELEIEKFLNIIIIDKNKQEVIFHNINENINTKLIENAVFSLEYNKIIQDENFLIKKITINENKNIFDVILLKKVRYSFNDYINDILYFFILTLIFSIIFYYVGYKFVGKNLEPVEKSLKDMQDFIHNAGHELKTPISIIHGNLQLINETKKFDKNLTKEGMNEINRLNKLIDSLIELSDIDRSFKVDNLNVKDEINKIIDENKQKLDEKNIKLKFLVKSDIDLKVNEEYFYILFSNLLGNAIKYNTYGGKINITLRKTNLTIEDTGIGIDEKDLNKVFDRFYQVDKSRNSVGFGIGLSMVKKISEIINWEIEVSSNKGKGTKFEIKF